MIHICITHEISFGQNFFEKQMKDLTTLGYFSVSERKVLKMDEFFSFKFARFGGFTFASHGRIIVIIQLKLSLP